MQLDVKKITAFSIVGMATFLCGASNSNGSDRCEPVPPAACYPADPSCDRCYGPENCAALAPVRPKTCDGDFAIWVAGFYWNVQQDGMEYAVKTAVVPDSRNSIIDAKYYAPDDEWEGGFKIGVGYNTACDGWDFGVEWTRYNPKGRDEVEAESDDNVTLLPLWSNFFVNTGLPTTATDIENTWEVDMNLIDVELGREFWVSKYVTLRPHIGFRVAFINQDFDICHKGGTFSTVSPVAVNDEVKLDNDFCGTGGRAGLDTVWNLSCGWGFYGNWAASVLFGEFKVKHDEDIRAVTAPFQKQDILDTSYDFKTARFAYDFEIGILWATRFCNCQYAFTAMLGWESHIFLDQNQLWRVTPIQQPTNQITTNNIFQQRRGDLSTQGWTLTFKFEF